MIPSRGDSRNIDNLGLCEVYNSEKILSIRSLIMEDVNFWKLDLRPGKSDGNNVQEFMRKVARLQVEIQESSLDNDAREVATTIAGYISLKLQTRSECTSCCKMLIANEDGIETSVQRRNDGSIL